METNGNQWKPMETSGNQWKPLETTKMRNIGVRSTRSIRLFLDIRHITGTSINKGMLMMVIHSCDSANAVKSAYFWSNPYFYKVDSCTLWLFNIAMENGPFIDDFPIKTSIYKGFSMAMLNKDLVQPPCLLVNLLVKSTCVLPMNFFGSILC